MADELSKVVVLFLFLALPLAFPREEEVDEEEAGVEREEDAEDRGIGTRVDEVVVLSERESLSIFAAATLTEDAPAAPAVKLCFGLVIRDLAVDLPLVVLFFLLFER